MEIITIKILRKSRRMLKEIAPLTKEKMYEVIERLLVQEWKRLHKLKTPR